MLLRFLVSLYKNPPERPFSIVSLHCKTRYLYHCLPIVLVHYKLISSYFCLSIVFILSIMSSDQDYMSKYDCAEAKKEDSEGMAACDEESKDVEKVDIVKAYFERQGLILIAYPKSGGGNNNEGDSGGKKIVGYIAWEDMTDSLGYYCVQSSRILNALFLLYLIKARLVSNLLTLRLEEGRDRKISPNKKYREDRQSPSLPS